MNEESILSKAESLRSELDTLRVLIDAVDSKISFFVREKAYLDTATHWSMPMLWTFKHCWLLSMKESMIWKKNRTSLSRWLTRTLIGKKSWESLLT